LEILFAWLKNTRQILSFQLKIQSMIALLTKRIFEAFTENKK